MSPREELPFNGASRQAAGALTTFHFLIFLYQSLGFGLVFLIWQIFELEQPWYMGPWHFVYVGWLVIYLAYAQYARCSREFQSVSEEFADSNEPNDEKLRKRFQRIQRHPAEISWWLRFPIFLLVLCTWPALVAIAALRHFYTIVVTPAKWPEAAVFVAAVLTFFLVPTYGAGPLLLTAVHIGLVILLRNTRTLRKLATE